MQPSPNSTLLAPPEHIPHKPGRSLDKGSPLRVALIGVSGFAQVHFTMISNAMESSRLKLLAATVINQEEEAEKCSLIGSMGGKLYQDYRQMLQELDGQIDLCFIPTGIHLHTPMTIAALRAGANVFVEKPAAATIQEVNAMQETERRSNQFVAVGYQTMYASETLWMKEAIINGKIGKIKSIKCRGLWPRFDSYYTRNNWAGRLRVGQDWMLDSPFNNAIGHQLNMICFLAGKELSKSAEIANIQAELYRARSIESADTACMRISTNDDISLYFYATHSSSGILNPEITVIGESGEVHWTFQKATLRTANDEVHEINCEQPASLRQQIIPRLAERINNSNAFICGLDIAKAQTLCVNGAHESSSIHEIPAQYIEKINTDGEIKTIVKELDATIQTAFRKEKLFSELGVPWAQSGKLIDLSDYKHFPTFREI
ncbi:Gfo/Idh/MocA family oxidoreductase [Rubellicoccus peritrichatus]|uniref:Gfo/Idh/MocA family oxidoreductase n=1 Tax=Rubellicoccus peritrichatus TaxID=3080537 RepID=A0AAQ3LEK3_9BACT|nr:Gfo/Idh/MocA family oxidoreductase [Puniceicoccus sp. CR14]WOO43267.1 Gfo/Idh/MocA family oxidoreductase [Puniceicoccus sp. CR14]